MNKLPTKTAQCGACNFVSISPQVLSRDTKAINLTVDFEEALKLKIGIDECVSRLNRYNRATSIGKKTVMKVVIHFDKKRVRILE